MISCMKRGEHMTEHNAKEIGLLGLSADYILFGTEQATDISDITYMLSGLDGKYIPKLKELLGAYLKTITLAEKQND